MVFGKVDFGGSKCTSRSLLLVDQSSPDFLRQTREESLSITYLFDFRYIRGRSLKSSEVDHNFARFGHQFLGGEDPPPNFSTGIIKLNTIDMWPSLRAIGRESSEISRSKKEKETAVKYTPAGNYHARRIAIAAPEAFVTRDSCTGRYC